MSASVARSERTVVHRLKTLIEAGFKSNRLASRLIIGAVDGDWNWILASDVAQLT
jgi:hypothetical protein